MKLIKILNELNANSLFLLFGIYFFVVGALDLLTPPHAVDLAKGFKINEMQYLILSIFKLVGGGIALFIFIYHLRKKMKEKKSECPAIIWKSLFFISIVIDVMILSHYLFLIFGACFIIYYLFYAAPRINEFLDSDD